MTIENTQVNNYYTYYWYLQESGTLTWSEQNSDGTQIQTLKIEIGTKMTEKDPNKN